jgi:hypothetical protein
MFFLAVTNIFGSTLKCSSLCQVASILSVSNASDPVSLYPDHGFDESGSNPDPDPDQGFYFMTVIFQKSADGK